ncbi:peptidyl-prolyl cis-trans isomerase CYP26-2, chloroplastic [Canna indica]|uniref:Peptidyl-prolyl cis-trans isomerase CYP26-2, chloroplastic n=1 Tax=Canna indica TaxID=4628 RepID=A0AAQ3Q9Z1_9LILI|nr:peptidyl-prolyl cis-trans isomerase CYP26-2, chloroplastic [Canna indica]
MRQQILRSLNPPPRIVQPAAASQPPNLHFHFSPPTPKTSCKLFRRDLAVAGSSLLPLLISTFFSKQAKANDEAPSTTTTNPEADSFTSTNEYCSNQPVTKKAFLDVSIDGEPAGRIIVGLFGDTAPFGSSRFTTLVTGTSGISYRRKEFIKILPNYIQHSGVRSYGVDAEIAKRAGGNLAADNLVAEWESTSKTCPGTKNTAGSLGLVIRDPTKPPPKLKLVARKGKLVIDEEEVRTDPNGTEFVITVKDSPELESSTLVVGRVLEGMDVVEKISRVKTVQENTSSPYFRVAKLIGDKRAVVAERGFNRPYSKGNAIFHYVNFEQRAFFSSKMNTELRQNDLLVVEIVCIK